MRCMHLVCVCVCCVLCVMCVVCVVCCVCCMCYMCCAGCITCMYMLYDVVCVFYAPDVLYALDLLYFGWVFCCVLYGWCVCLLRIERGCRKLSGGSRCDFRY